IPGKFSNSKCQAAAAFLFGYWSLENLFGVWVLGFGISDVSRSAPLREPGCNDGKPTNRPARPKPRGQKSATSFADGIRPARDRTPPEAIHSCRSEVCQPRTECRQGSRKKLPGPVAR